MSGLDNSPIFEYIRAQRAIPKISVATNNNNNNNDSSNNSNSNNINSINSIAIGSPKSDQKSLVSASFSAKNMTTTSEAGGIISDRLGTNSNSNSSQPTTHKYCSILGEPAIHIFGGNTRPPSPPIYEVSSGVATRLGNKDGIIKDNVSGVINEVNAGLIFDYFMYTYGFIFSVNLITCPCLFNCFSIYTRIIHTMYTNERLF